MSDQHTQHTMQLVKTHTSGAEEWHCPTCDRRFIMQWPPHYKRIVLTPGDEQAIHNGVRGELMHLGAVTLTDQIEDAADDAPLSEEWQRGLDEAGFDSWWNNPPSEN